MYSTTCPCGVTVQEADEDTFVDAVMRHVNQVHPEETANSNREQILAMAQKS